jgi:hypothetical protein
MFAQKDLREGLTADRRPPSRVHLWRLPVYGSSVQNHRLRVWGLGEASSAGPRLAAAIADAPLHLDAVPHYDPLHEVKKKQSERVVFPSIPFILPEDRTAEVHLTVRMECTWGI